MSQQDSSLQAQNPISSAQNSVENAHNAVSHALSHPTAQTEVEALNAIEQANNALVQLNDQSDRPEVQQANEALDEEVNRLNNLQ
ncbi:hypothetical protein [Paenibacillus whitsoniae]|uniref:Uncharacterized protein n=1 Tax=Paenibacillus whitsoniae TaxID=2496558 RepID=A0A3S0IF57_9BACL|nr:hypothetical protein [Paenibacillus whitsoniae]RTE11606.1 hypothetical protein EJQ19_00870 [Paenibacillus whitsoniae]